MAAILTVFPGEIERDEGFKNFSNEYIFKNIYCFSDENFQRTKKKMMEL